jgi:pSer/pThr/pTyr-binding forkhead associated (FHA) protein
MPPNPKRRQSRRGEPPFEEGEILRADDPRPQRVTQYPSATVGRRRKNEEAIPTSVYDTDAQDEELKASYDGKSMDAGGKPAFLYVEKGPGAGQLVPVRQGVLVIGRASVSDLRLQHPSISRRHSQLTRRGERFFFKDLGSQNGTFVNKVKIDREVELTPGDSIGMGAALLKLRGPLNRSEAATEGMRLKQQKAMPTAVVQRPRSSGVVKAMMFAGAVGFGLAAVLAFAVFRSPGAAKAGKEGKSTKVIAIAPEVVQPKAARRFQAEPATDEIEIAAGPVQITRERRIEEAIERKMAEQKAKEPAPKPTEPVKVAEQPAAETRPAAAEPKKASAPAAKAEKEEPAPKAQPASKRALLASYEKGDAEGSIEAAKEAGDKALVAQLQKFVAAFDAAEAAYDKNDAKTAIARYEEALAIDQKLSDGFGQNSKEIRKKLSNIWLLAGQQFLKSSQNDGARNALKESLKYDPSNSKAKSALASLDKEAKHEDAAAEEDEKPVAKKATAKKASAADDAFGEDEEDAKPKKKPAAKKAAAARSAADDAFGD